MKPADETRLAAHVAQHRLACGAQWVAGAAGLIGAAWHGLPSILLGAAGVWFFGLAKPGPDRELDKLTGRDQ